mmetsp:Transcript_1105/g.1038  ORF Transcript_1105/g.1038 Transcript_1105/m.1038 type:complete len:149 (+) Transcript_1105:3-449(+)
MMSEFECGVSELGDLHWDWIHLGQGHHSGYRGIVSDSLARSGFDWGCQAVAFSKEGAKSIVDRSKRLLNKLVAWDLMLPTLQLGQDHPIEWYRKLWQHHYADDGENPSTALSFVFPLANQFVINGKNRMAISDITYLDDQDLLIEQLK